MLLLQQLCLSELGALLIESFMVSVLKLTYVPGLLSLV